MLRATLALLALALPTAAQTTWHVDIQGTPPGNGTPGNPYTSIQYAIERATTVDGDTLLVAPGLYTQEVDNKSKGISVRSSGGALVTFIQAPPGSTGVTVLMNHKFSAPIPVLEGFTIAGPATGGTYGVQLIDGAILRHCIVTGHRGAGGLGSIGVQGFLDGSRVESCTIVDNDVGASDHGHFGDIALHDTVLDGNSLDLNYFGVGITANWCAWRTQNSVVFGSNNLVLDPGLWNPLEGDPQLGPSSPCIDSGDPTLPPDPDGSPNDRGAVPFDDDYLPPITVYCTSKVNSGGCLPPISTRGGASASVSSPAPFLVEAVGIVENKAGLLFYGTSGRRAVPFMGGFHCVEPPVKRTAVMSSGNTGPAACKGLFSFDFNAYLHTPAGALILAGTMVNAQYWYRNPGDPFGSATTDAVEFPVGL